MKPENADFYSWNRFIQFCEEERINLENEEDWEVWWNCWKTAYISAMNSE